MQHDSYKIDFEYDGERLDKFLASVLEEHSRSFIQKLIKEKKVTVDGKKVTKTGFLLKEDMLIKIDIPSVEVASVKAENIPLDIIYEDNDLLVVNKAAGMVVHPDESGHMSDTLVNALLHHCGKNLSTIGGYMRPGIVHRLDKDTSGLLLVAKNNDMHEYLSTIIKDRKVYKEYTSLVKGVLEVNKGVIDAPIGRNIKDRKKMSVIGSSSSRDAITNFSVIKSFSDSSLLKIQIITGRTHQIRVHLQSISHPVLGDIIYGDKSANKYFKEHFNLDTMFLHAAKLRFVMPSGEEKSFEAPLVKKLQDCLEALESSEELQ